MSAGVWIAVNVVVILIHLNTVRLAIRDRQFSLAVLGASGIFLSTAAIVLFSASGQK